MRFRLTYEGPLLSSKPGGDTNRRIAHKHSIRQAFHCQLSELWKSNRFLQRMMLDKTWTDVLPEKAIEVFEANPARRPMANVLGDIFGHDGYRYSPLIWKEAELACSLRILCLRRDGNDALASARDIDNRIKTVIDALTMVLPRQGAPVDEQGNALKPEPGEDPFFVLLDDDRQVTHLEVETDTALAPDPNIPSNLDFVRLIITVETRVIHSTMFNLSYA